jgi:hypothetical protein
MGCQARGGEGSAMALTYKDENGRYRVAVAYVGEDGIEADTWYGVTAMGEFEGVTMKPPPSPGPDGHAIYIGRARLVWTSADGVIDQAGFDEVCTNAADGGLVRAVDVSQVTDSEDRKAA